MSSASNPQAAVVPAISFGTTSTAQLLPWIAPADPSPTNVNFKVGKKWINSLTGNQFYLASITASLGTLSANWVQEATSIGGVVQVAQGGTGDTTLTAHGVLLGEGTSPVVASAAGTSGQVFTSGGASADGAYATLGTNSGLTGLLLGNGNSAATAVTYVPSTAWTPNLQIGGSDTGITYGATPSGYYQQIGNLVFFTAAIALSSKGVSSGQVSISNMPVEFGANGSINNLSVAEFGNITLTTNYTAIGLTASANTTILIFDQIGSGQAITTLTGTQMADNSSVFISGFYFIT